MIFLLLQIGKQVAFFKHVLHREFCEMAPGVNGKAWDTVKPLAKHVSDLNRCILFDDDEYKGKQAT